MTLDLTKPLRIRRLQGTTVECRLLASDIAGAKYPIVVWTAMRGGVAQETVWQFDRDGNSAWIKGATLENIPEPKVTEAPIWRLPGGGVFADTGVRGAPSGWSHIGTLRITEVEGEKPRVEVV